MPVMVGEEDEPPPAVRVHVYGYHLRLEAVEPNGAVLDRLDRAGLAG
jgi:hypothetical protein